MADVGFDSDKHAQTSGDMEKGGQSLTDSTQAISRLIDAQKAEYWSEEEGFQAMRRSLISYLRTEKDVVSNQMVRFEKFDGDVDTAASAFEAAEQGNTDELARILASMDPQPTGAPSSPATQAPSQIAGGGTTSSGNANGATSTGAGGSGSGAGTSPTQNAPSEF
nr:hypothetical protein [Schaalia odontolytica]